MGGSMRRAGLAIAQLFLAGALSVAPSALAQSLELRSELAELCADDRAGCLTLFRELVADGALDGDRDGVSDLADRCPGTPSALARAEALLLDRKLVLARTIEAFEGVREVLRYRSVSTLGEHEHELLALEVAQRFDELFELANTRTPDGFLFGGGRDDTPPFERSGGFALVPTSVPQIRYVGGREVGSVPPNRFGGGHAVSVPGDQLFLGDLDGDGLYPDPDAVDLFQELALAYAAFANGLAAVVTRLAVTDADLGYLERLDHELSLLFRRVSRSVVSPAEAGVDTAGCSPEQFCAAVRVGRRAGGWSCLRSDFANDEPLRFLPRDCRVAREESGRRGCVAADEGEELRLRAR